MDNIDFEAMSSYDKVRKLYGFNGKLPQYGERLICRSNDRHEVVEEINLANGLIGSVVNFPDVSGFDGKTFELWFQPDLLNDSFKVRASYKYFIAPHQQKEKFTAKNVNLHMLKIVFIKVIWKNMLKTMVI